VESVKALLAGLELPTKGAEILETVSTFSKAAIRAAFNLLSFETQEAIINRLISFLGLSEILELIRTSCLMV